MYLRRRETITIEKRILSRFLKLIAEASPQSRGRDLQLFSHDDVLSLSLSPPRSLKTNRQSIATTRDCPFPVYDDRSHNVAWQEREFRCSTIYGTKLRERARKFPKAGSRWSDGGREDGREFANCSPIARNRDWFGLFATDSRRKQADYIKRSKNIEMSRLDLLLPFFLPFLSSGTPPQRATLLRTNTKR